MIRSSDCLGKKLRMKEESLIAIKGETLNEVKGAFAAEFVSCSKTFLEMTRLKA